MKKAINPDTLAYPTPVWCVGTYDRDNKPNVMTIAWGGICNSKPASITISLREATYTYGNIMARKAYTVSIPSTRHAAEADYFGIASGRDTDKFKQTGLTPVRSDVVDAPYVDEFPLVLECRVVHIQELGLHTQFVGEIKGIKVDEEALGENGKPLIAKVDPLVYSPGDRDYRSVGDILGKGFDMGKRFK